MRHAIFSRLQQVCVRGRLPRGALRDLALTYGCHERTIRRVWDQGQASILDGAAAVDVASKMAGIDSNDEYICVVMGIETHGLLIVGNCGEKSKWDAAAVERAIKAVPHHLRQTLRCLAVK